MIVSFFLQPKHYALQPDEFSVIAIENVTNDLFGCFFVIRLNGQSFGLDHIHPSLAILDQPTPEGEAKDVTAAMDIGLSLVFEVVFE